MKKNQKKYISSLFLAILLPILLTGCFDKREIDEMAYPLALGLDIGEANVLRMTLQLAAPLSIGSGGGGEGGGGGGESSESSSIITVDTPSIYSGLNLINNIISKEINMTHAKVIILSKRLAEKDIAKYLHALQRGREFRPDIFVMVSKEPPDEYLKNVKPTLESNPAKYYELLLGKSFTAFYPIVRMHEFYFNAESDSIEPVAVLTGLSKFQSADQLKKEDKVQDTSSVRPEGRYEAGNIPILSKQKNEVMGTAVFKDTKMVGTINGTESACMQMVTGEYDLSYWTMPDAYEEDKIVVMSITQRKKPSIKIGSADGKPQVQISMDLEGDFTSIQSDRNYEDYPEAMENVAEKIIKEEILALLKRTTTEFNSDICGFGRYAKGNFLTWDAWKRYNWSEQYKEAQFSVDIKLKTRRTGLMIRSVTQ